MHMYNEWVRECGLKISLMFVKIIICHHRRDRAGRTHQQCQQRAGEQHRACLGFGLSLQEVCHGMRSQYADLLLKRLLVDLCQLLVEG